MKKQILFCSAVILMITSAVVNAQVTTPANTGSSGDYVGWANTENFDLNVKHNGAYNINFYTNGNPHGKIDVNGNFTIGLTNSNNYFGIGNATPVLWHDGESTNILVGVNAGNATMVAGTAVDNTFLGYNAGNPLRRICNPVVLYSLAA